MADPTTESAAANVFARRTAAYKTLIAENEDLATGNNKYTFIHFALNGDIRMDRLDAMINDIRQCKRDVDFQIIGLIRLLYLIPKEKLLEKDMTTMYTVRKITAALDDFPFWPSYDEPRLHSDELCFWSENHILMLLSSAHLYRQWKHQNVENTGTGGIYAKVNRVEGQSLDIDSHKHARYTGGLSNISYIDASKPKVYERSHKGTPSKSNNNTPSKRTSEFSPGDKDNGGNEERESVTVQHSPALSLYYQLHSEYIMQQATKQSLQRYSQYKRLNRYNKHLERKHSLNSPDGQGRSTSTDGKGRRVTTDGHGVEEGEEVRNSLWVGALSVFSLSGKNNTPATTPTAATYDDIPASSDGTGDSGGNDRGRMLSKDLYGDDNDENEGTSAKGGSFQGNTGVPEDDYNDSHIAMSPTTSSKLPRKSRRKTRRKTAAVSEAAFDETRRRRQFLEVEVDIDAVDVPSTTRIGNGSGKIGAADNSWQSADTAYASEGLKLEGEDLEEALLHSYLHAHIRFDAMFEVNSHVYLPYSISALMNLYDFTEDEAIRSMARKVIDIAIKHVLLCTTDTGVCSLSASARAFTRTRQRVHGHNLNQLIRMLVGTSPDDLWPSPITDFLTTTAWRPSDELKQYYELQGRVSMRVSFPLDDVKELFPGIPSHERVPFYWSAGLVVHPDFVEETKRFQQIKHMEHQHSLWPISWMANSWWTNLNSSYEILTRGQVYCDLNLNIYKKNGGLCMSSFEHFNVGQVNFQQLPWIANVDGVGVWAQSGVINNTVSGFAVTNINAPYVTQKGSILISSYKTNVSTSCSFSMLFGGLLSNEVNVVWPVSLFDVHRLYLSEDDHRKEQKRFKLSSLFRGRKQKAMAHNNVCSDTGAHKNVWYSYTDSTEYADSASWRVASRHACYIGVYMSHPSTVSRNHEKDKNAAVQIQYGRHHTDKTAAQIIKCNTTAVTLIVVVGSHDEYNGDFDAFINRCLSIQVQEHYDPGAAPDIFKAEKAEKAEKEKREGKIKDGKKSGGNGNGGGGGGGGVSPAVHSNPKPYYVHVYDPQEGDIHFDF